jgi:hypothetical protein
VREIRTLRVMWRGLETGLRQHFGATASVPDPTNLISNRLGLRIQKRNRVYNHEEVVIPLILTRPMVG